MKTGLVRCVCRGWCQGRRYTCPRCMRFAPECFGAADDFGAVCDDCMVECVDGAADADQWQEVAR